MPEIKHCCAAFSEATEGGTDNEGYGALIRDFLDDGWEIGCRLKLMRFCPWCAAPVNDGKPEPERA